MLREKNINYCEELMTNSDITNFTLKKKSRQEKYDKKIYLDLFDAYLISN